MSDNRISTTADRPPRSPARETASIQREIAAAQRYLDRHPDASTVSDLIRELEGELNDCRMAAVVRRLRNQTARPPGVSREEVQAAFDAGLIKFVHCAASHYSLTEAGHAFLAEH